MAESIYQFFHNHPTKKLVEDLITVGLEMPGPANGYTAVVRIEDEKSGADTYEFELTWQR